VRVGGGSRRLALLGGALLALLVPSGAAAATIVNGDFESGTLRGWQVYRAMGAGNWFPYKGTAEPIANKRGGKPIPTPPQGSFAAIADAIAPDTLVLFQDIALEPGLDHRLSLLVYYESRGPIAVPTPDTLSVREEDLGEQANQQYRIDVMRPGAPIESIDPADILRTIFRTRPGAPQKLQPTQLTVDLSPFAGQTVRLRMAAAIHEEVFAAGVDAVSIGSAPPGQLPQGGHDQLRVGKPKANRRNGTVTLPVHLPGPGRLAAKGRSIRSLDVGAAQAGTVRLLLTPKRAARAILKRKHKLRAKVAVVYRPAGGSSETASVPVRFRLAPRR
jgi:hypothetical protein